MKGQTKVVETKYTGIWRLEKDGCLRGEIVKSKEGYTVFYYYNENRDSFYVEVFDSFEKAKENAIKVIDQELFSTLFKKENYSF